MLRDRPASRKDNVLRAKTPSHRATLFLATSMVLVPVGVGGQAVPAEVPNRAAGGAGPPAPFFLDPHAAGGPSGAPTGDGLLLAFPTFVAGAGLDPVGLRDLGRFAGRTLPRSTREDWLSRIARSGRELGSGYVAAGMAAARWGIAITLEVEGFAELDLTEDAAELLLFGNSGRTGAARDLAVAGSSVRGLATTSLGVGRSWEIGGGMDGERTRVGARLRWVSANGLVYGSGVAGGTQTSPVEVDLRFPVLETLDRFSTVGSPNGWSLDLGGTWNGADGAWRAAVAIHDAFSSFRWRPADLSYRPGTAIFTSNRADTDFDRRPVEGTDLPDEVQALVEQLEGLRFRALVRMGLGFRAREDLELLGAVERTAREGIRSGMGNGTSVGFRWIAHRDGSVSGGVRRSAGSTRWTVGGGWRIGPASIDAGWAWTALREGNAQSLAFSLTWKGRS